MGNRARVLAVDADPQMLWYVRTTLSEAGYTPIVTEDPEEVDLLIEVENPDLVLLDLALPGTDGAELMKRIPEITAAPVVFLSGRGEDQDVARAFEMGADDYVVKPFSPPSWWRESRRLCAGGRRPFRPRDANPMCWGTWPSTTANAA